MPIPLLFQEQFTENFQEASPFENSVSALRWVISGPVTLDIWLHLCRRNMYNAVFSFISGCKMAANRQTDAQWRPEAWNQWSWARPLRITRRRQQVPRIPLAFLPGNVKETASDPKWQHAGHDTRTLGSPQLLYCTAKPRSHDYMHVSHIQSNWKQEPGPQSPAQRKVHWIPVQDLIITHFQFPILRENYTSQCNALTSHQGAGE